MSSKFTKIKHGINITSKESLPNVGSAGDIVYDVNDSKLKTWNGAAWVPLGYGGGTGVNYLQLSNKPWDAEGTAVGFNTYKDSVDARPVDGVGGTPSVIFPVEISNLNPISGSQSFLLTKGPGNAQGEGWSIDFQVDLAAKARILNIEFDYIIDSGVFNAGNFADPTPAGDSDLIVCLYDVNLNQLIYPTTLKLLSSSTNIVDKFRASFQTSATSTFYRLIFHVATTNTASWTVKLDNIQITPTNYSQGTIITDWTEYVPTFNSGFTVGTGGSAYRKWYWRRVGGDIEIKGSFKLGTSGFSIGSGMFMVSIPSWASFDPNRMSGIGVGINGADYGRFGYWGAVDHSGSGIREIGYVIRNGNSLNTVYFDIRTDAGIGGAMSATFPFTWGPNDEFFTEFRAPIAGWSSIVKISEPMENREVVFRARRISSDQTLTANTTNVEFNDILLDTTNSWDSVNRVFKAPLSGTYVIIGGLTSSVVGNYWEIYVNGTYFSSANHRTDAASLNSGITAILPNIKSGDTISIRSNENCNLVANTTAQVVIYRLSSPQIQAQSEQCYGFIRKNTSQNIPSGSVTTLTGWVKDQDSHNTFNATTGDLVVPKSGILSVSFSAPRYSTSSSAGIREYRIEINGVLAANCIELPNASGVQPKPVVSVLGYRVNAGDIVRFRLFQDSGISLNTSTAANESAFVSWKID